ncbi:MAG: histidinol-phosphate transaminase [Leptolyngbya sp. RL_3_1]|nr:histidinol-phosphate transaminase [Leptolyngbya sp. RL_3_1]
MLPCIRPDLAEFAAYSAHPAASLDPEPAIIDSLDTNECAYDLPEALKDKLAFAYQQAIASNRYPDGSHGALKAAIAIYVNESAALRDITAAHISVGNGSDELIRSLLIATCVGRSGAILVADPTFSMYGILATTLGIPVVHVPRDDNTFAVDVDAAQAAIQASEQPVRVVFMVHPNSPTANALTDTELAWLKQLPTDVLVVIDEAYFEFSQQTTVSEMLTRPNWVVTRTFSKAFRLAAHRVGYSIASPEVTQVLEKVRLPYNLPSLSYRAAQIALAHRQDLLAIITEVLGERDRLHTAMAQLPHFRLWPSDANFVYGRPAGDPAVLFQALRRLGTNVRHTGGGLRITIGTPAENQRTLDHLQQALQQTLTAAGPLGS